MFLILDLEPYQWCEITTAGSLELCWREKGRYQVLSEIFWVKSLMDRTWKKHFNRLSGWFWCILKFQNHCLCCLVSKSCPTLTTPWTVAYQAPLSMGFLRQEHWSGLPFPSPFIILCKFWASKLKSMGPMSFERDRRYAVRCGRKRTSPTTLNFLSWQLYVYFDLWENSSNYSFLGL